MTSLFLGFLEGLNGCISQVPRKLIGTDAFQETPIVEVTRQITKHNYLVMDLDDLPRIVKEVTSLSSFLSPKQVCTCAQICDKSR